MVATATADSMQATLSQWLRLLWDMAPPLRLDSDVPYLSGGVIHLPARSHWRLHSAAAAHAAAHLVYSPPSFDGAGLGPIARVLTALLEDARVEALAMRELPGLARLWRPLHTATPELGTDFEALLQRLARSLVDPAYDDPEAWVRKGRALFYLDAGLGLLALRTPAEVRRAALRLGHDIGQMRLQFNAKNHCSWPPYRDDHRWMWAADALSPAAPPPAAPAGGPSDDMAVPDVAATVTLHPEWDHLISRVRPDWCRVVEQPAWLSAVPHGMVDDAVDDVVADALVQQTGRRLRAPLRALMRHAGERRLGDEGELFDSAALLAWRIARRLGQPGDARVYRALVRRAGHATVWLLVDQSASTAAAISPAQGPGLGGQSVLQTAARSAAAAAATLEAIGVRCRVVGFSSRGRHAISLVIVKELGEPAAAARLHALRAGGSTRLGAALRHATLRLAQHGGGPRWVIVLSDGEAHDIDVHDPRYLVEDARHAVRSAARRAVRVACLVIAPASITAVGADLRRIFGAHGAQPVQGLARLPKAVQRLSVNGAR